MPHSLIWGMSVSIARLAFTTTDVLKACILPGRFIVSMSGNWIWDRGFQYISNLGEILIESGVTANPSTKDRVSIQREP